MKSYVYIILCFLITTEITKAQPPATTASKYKSKFNSLYSADSASNEDVEFVQNNLSKIKEYKGLALKGPQELLNVLESISSIRGRAAKLFLFGILQRNIDKNSLVAKQQYDVGSKLYSDVEAAISFLNEDVAKLGSEKLSKWIKKESRLKPYQLRLFSILNKQKHKLTSGEERLISYLEKANRISSDSYLAFLETLTNWPILNTDEGLVELNPTNFRKIRREGTKDIRQIAAKKYYEYLGRHSELMGVLLTRRVENDISIAQVKNIPNTLDAFWVLTEGIPEGSVEQMIAAVNRNLPLLKEYLSLRSKAMGFKDINLLDLYAIPKSIDKNYEADEVINITKLVVNSVDSSVINKIDEVIKRDLLHLAYSESKSTEWGILPGVLDSLPYLRMNYKGTYSDARNLVGGLLTLIKFYSRPNDLVFDGIDDSAISVTLYLGQMLFNDYLRNNSKTREEKLSYLLVSLDRMWRSFFHNILMVELIQKVEELIKVNKPPSGHEISSIYLELLEKYYGKDNVPKYMAFEWMNNYVPFLSNSFQNWPASIAVASLFSEKLRSDDKKMKNVYFTEVNSTQTSDRIYDLLIENGVDMSQGETYEYAIQRMKNLIEELHSEINDN